MESGSKELSASIFRSCKVNIIRDRHSRKNIFASWPSHIYYSNARSGEENNMERLSVGLLEGGDRRNGEEKGGGTDQGTP